MNQFPPSPRESHLGPFRIFSKIRGDIRKSRCTTGINDTGGKFATGLNKTVVHFELRISPRIFEKNRNGPNGILKAWGKLIYEKIEVENLVTLSL